MEYRFETILPLQPIPGADNYVGKTLIGYCPVCNRATSFGPFAEDVRESGYCLKCNASNRHRQVMATLKQLFQVKPYEDTYLQDLAILLAETNSPIATALGRCGCSLICTEYLGPEFQSGTMVDGVRHEDLMASSFLDESIDVVITSDVFEHIPDAYQAFQEVARILKPGGVHIFTVPFNFHTLVDDLRSYIDANGQRVDLKENVFHLDPIRPEGILVYRIFSVEMLISLEKLGLVPELLRVTAPDWGIVGSNALVFTARKR